MTKGKKRVRKKGRKEEKEGWMDCKTEEMGRWNE